MRYATASVLIIFALLGCSGGDPIHGMTLSTKSTDVSDPSEFLADLGTPLTITLDEKNSQPASLAVHRLADLWLPSGQVIAADGFIMFNRKPFTRTVKPGRYPLVLAVAKLPNGDERVGFAMLRFVDTPVAKWEMAVTEGQDVATLKKDETFGYGVDSGTGSFADPGAQKLIEQEDRKGREFFRLVSAEMKKVRKHTRDWVHIDTANGSAALFSSGFGDGHYASYFGLDESGNVVALVTDFGIVDWPRQAKREP